jgi:hypothetical protein
MIIYIYDLLYIMSDIIYRFSWYIVYRLCLCLDVCTSYTALCTSITIYVYTYIYTHSILNYPCDAHDT